MDGQVDVNVEVPASSLNIPSGIPIPTSPGSPNSPANASQEIQIQSNETIPSQNISGEPATNSSVLFAGIALILIALVLTAFLFRGRIIDFVNKR